MRGERWTMRRVAVIATAVALGVFASAQRPTGGVPGKQVSSPTRQVTMFTSLERQLLDAQKDKTLLDAMLTEDFQEWSAEQPAAAIGRDEAMQLALAAGKVQGAIRDMNVRMEGDVAVVSFVLLHRAEQQGSGERSNATYIVDIWRKHGETFELAARYAAPMRMQAMRDMRPTGRQ